MRTLSKGRGGQCHLLIKIHWLHSERNRRPIGIVIANLIFGFFTLFVWKNGIHASVKASKDMREKSGRDSINILRWEVFQSLLNHS